MKHPELASIFKYCITHGEEVKYDKDSSFVCEHTLCRHIAVVRSGYFKNVVINRRGDECITGFSFQGDIVTGYVRSFLHSRPALTSIVAGIDSKVCGTNIPQHIKQTP